MPVLHALSLTLTHAKWWALCWFFALAMPTMASGQTQAVTDGMAIRSGNAALKLDGSWRFSAGTDLEGGQVLARALFEKSAGHTLLVPGNWSAKQPAAGQGTYQVQLQGLEVGRLYAMQFKGISSSASIWLDEALLGRWGTMGLQFFPKTYYFEASTPQALLSVSVNNHLLNFGGLWYPVVLGPVEAVDAAAQTDRFYEAILMGGIVIIAIYHMGLFWFRRQDPASLHFAVFCLMAVFKASLSGEQLMYLLLPQLDQGVGLRIAFLLVIAMPMAFSVYIHALFPTARYVPLMKASGLIGAPTALLCTFGTYEMMQTWFWVYQLAIVGAMVHIIATLVRAWRSHLPGAAIMLAGFVLLFVGALNDILHDNKIIVTFYALNLGVFAFLIMQSLLMGGMFARAFQHVAELNESLEHKVAQRTQELEELARRDSLTWLMNRRWFLQELQQEWERWSRYGHDFCVALIDLDHFKKINDTQGHGAGDKSLKKVAALLQSQVRKTDLVARYGGEEFCILFPSTSVAEAGAVMEKVRELCVTQNGLSFSYGVARASHHTAAQELVATADQLMYAAKEAGRNQGRLDTEA
jgi:diguanylate cyclase (GGDEF)-like protein